MRARRPLRVILVACATAAGAVSAQAIPASAHVGLITYGTTFTAGATNVIYFRVPHGCTDPEAATYGGFNAQTTRVEVTIPAGATGVRPEKKPGWDVAVQRTPVTNVVEKVTWTAHDGEALPDWTYGDFGVRATLNGVAGTVLEFPTTQFCALHNDEDPLLPPVAIAPELEHAWVGVDAPKLTLVGAASKVATAADLANLKDRVVSLETSVTGALSSIAGLLNADTSLDSRLDALESGLGGLSATNFLPTPLRSYDSRDNAGAKIAAMETRTISLTSGVDGLGVSTPAVPAGASAAIVTLTVTETTGPGGFLQLYAADSAVPATSSINWAGNDQNLSVSTLVAVDASGQVKITGGANSTHFIVDVIGYVN
jgi:periplasmic copper chaperone A